MPDAMMSFVPAPGGRMITNKADAELVYREFERLKKKYGDGLTPQTVLDEARPPSSRLHRFFDWDDSEAAEKWRLSQAGKLCREVHVVVKYEDRPAIRTGAIVNIVKDTGRTLESVKNVMSDEEYQRQRLSEALKELNAFRRKYAHLTALAGVFEEADRVIKTFSTASLPKPTRRRR